MTKTGFFKTPKEDSEEYIKLMTEAYDTLEYHINFYFDKWLIAVQTSIKEKNERAIKQFNVYMREEKETHMSFLNQAKFALSGAKIKIKNYLGLKNETYGYMSEFMGKTMALIAIPKVDEIILEHIELVEQNKKLLSELK